MEREGKMLRHWSCDQLELKYEGKAVSVTSCTVANVLVHDYFCDPLSNRIFFMPPQQCQPWPKALRFLVVCTYVHTYSTDVPFS